MNTLGNSLLKIYASTTDKIGFDLVYEHIIHVAKQNKIAGVTVYRGIMGFGKSSMHIEQSRFWELTEKLPVVIEIIDNTEAIESFYELIKKDLEKVPKGCLVTLQAIDIKLQKMGISMQ
ncbi:MAG: hypothetical protein AUK44_09815 [Porphyromonadaceae bacterium CG2_30_38_12]|nr:MAG: hypothetical protein AUK44_09815 [Porphyromonadaceae bacterium CG2_30_38_12]